MSNLLLIVTALFRGTKALGEVYRGDSPVVFVVYAIRTGSLFGTAVGVFIGILFIADSMDIDSIIVMLLAAATLFPVVFISGISGFIGGIILGAILGILGLIIYRVSTAIFGGSSQIVTPLFIMIAGALGGWLLANSSDVLQSFDPGWLLAIGGGIFGLTLGLRMGRGSTQMGTLSPIVRSKNSGDDLIDQIIIHGD